MATKMTREEALNKVRQMSLPKETMEILEALAPELAESEDEKIRKAIIRIIKNSNVFDINVSHERMFAYLEKQAEQKQEKFPPYVTGFKGHPDPAGTSDLEEAAARYERENRQSILSSVDIVDAFIAGAEWQKEQKPADYEAMADLERTYFSNPDKLPKWLKDDIARKELNAHTKGYNKGYKDAGYNESVAYHYPDSIPPGIAYKSPKCYTDVMITPNTHSGTSTLKAEG